MMLYKNTKAVLPSLNGDSNFFDTVAGILQEDTLVPYLFIIWTDYVRRKSKDRIEENCLT